MRDKAPLINYCLVDRILELYDPLAALDLIPLSLERLDKTKPEAHHIDIARPRSDEYHYGRIRYFMDTLLAGQALEPVAIDNKCSGKVILPELDMLDGHHRLIAYALTKALYIPVYYAGRLDLLEYLEGEVDTCPTTWYV